MRKPSEKELYKCAVELANQIEIEPLDVDEARKLFDYLIYSEDGKNILAALESGLVTEIEVRKFMVDHVFTTTMKKNGWPKLPEDASLVENIPELFENALFGRLAVPTYSDLNPPSNEELTSGST